MSLPGYFLSPAIDANSKRQGAPPYLQGCHQLLEQSLLKQYFSECFFMPVISLLKWIEHIYIHVLSSH